MLVSVIELGQELNGRVQELSMAVRKSFSWASTYDVCGQKIDGS